MPTYEYVCTKCGREWELFQSILAAPEKSCPKCGRATAKRKIGMGAAILSGGRSSGGDDGAAAAGTGGAKPADGGAPKADGPKDAGAAKDATSKTNAPAGTEPAKAPKAAQEGTLNSTHPARDGRGAGNLRDAIARQRAAAAKKSCKSPAKKPAKATKRASR